MTNTFTHQQLRAGFRGHVYSAQNRATFVGGAYLINGKAYLMQVNDGHVISYEEKSPASFIKAGREQLSAARSIQNWTLA
jgi:hypothetical protein